MSADIIDESTGEIVQVAQVDGAAAYVARQDAAMLDVQVATAKRYPRSVQRFQSELEAWCTLNRETAIECFFAMPRDGQQVVGPSVRFAELVQAAYGNLVVDSQIVEEGREFVIVSATCRDLERNIASRAQVRRNITKRGGKRYSQSMVETTIMAASAIARRNAIFQTVPKALWSPLYAKARHVAHGSEKEFATRRSSVTKALRAAGCDMKNVKAFVGGKDSKDLSKDEVLLLEIKLTAIESNEVTPEGAFPEPRPETPEDGRSAQLATEALNSAKGDTPAPGDESQEPEAEPEDASQAPGPDDTAKLGYNEYVQSKNDRLFFGEDGA